MRESTILGLGEKTRRNTKPVYDGSPVFEATLHSLIAMTFSAMFYQEENAYHP